MQVIYAVRYFFDNRHLIVVRVDEETWELVVEGGRILRGDRLEVLWPGGALALRQLSGSYTFRRNQK